MKKSTGFIFATMVLVAIGTDAAPLSPAALKLAQTAYWEELQTALDGKDGAVSRDAALKIVGVVEAVKSVEAAKAYDENEIAGDNRFKGKRVLVTGRIQEIAKNVFGQASLHLAGGKPLHEVHAGLNKSEMDQAAKLKKGDIVGVICTGAGKVLLSAVFKDCVLLDGQLAAKKPITDAEVEKFLSGQAQMPMASAEGIVFIYNIGTDLPSDSPCFRDLASCTAIWDKIEKKMTPVQRDAFKQRLQAMLKTLKVQP